MSDPFADARRDRSLARTDDGLGNQWPMALDHAEVKRVLKDWKTFSSDDPRHITIKPETEVRDVRQLPIETDPPEHTEYRKLVDPFFRRALEAGYREQMAAMVDDAVAGAVAAGEVEVVRGLGLPLQNRSLGMMLGVGGADVEVWMSWGLHVFYGDGPSKGDALAAYARQKFASAGDEDDDFFSTLNRVEYQGRRLTQAEKEGFANLAFAGGRDTVIQSIAAAVAALAEGGRLDWLREDEGRLSPAIEEIIRHLSPVGGLARRCPHGGELAGETLEPGSRVLVSYAAANYDEAVFACPAEVRLDRTPNPHLAFGFGKHHCLGAHQARLVMQCLLQSLCARVGQIEVAEAVPAVEREPSHTRQLGYESLTVKLVPRE